MGIFYSALLLTGVNLLLRLIGTGFQMYLSGRIGAAGMGLLQLVLSVGTLAMVAGTAGIRTGAMYLCAGELGRKRPGNVGHVLSGCFLYSFLCSASVGLGLWSFSDRIAVGWIGNREAAEALRLLGAFLPCICLSGVLAGYFTAAGRIGTLAAVEVAEQLAVMGVTIRLLRLAEGDPGRVCCAIVGGSCLGGMLTLLALAFLRLRERADCRARCPLHLMEAAVPLALGDLLRTGISTTEQLMVPKRLALCPGAGDPLAAFGILGAMVFPLMMLPSSLLFGLNELLIPELARCRAAGSQSRIRYLVGKALRLTFLYGVLCFGLLRLLAEPLCLRFYGEPRAGVWLGLYAPLVPMLYCDGVVDAMTKGLGQQKVCVRYNILTNGLDVLLLFFLLPVWGIRGYFLSFLVTHLLNFLLSLGRLLKITGLTVPVRMPLITVSCALVSLKAVSPLPLFWAVPAFCALLGSLLVLCGILGKGDLHWLLRLIKKKRPAEAGRFRKIA